MKKSSEKKLLIGAHCGGGLKGAVGKALEINAQVMQIFIGSPQTWKAPTPSSSQFNEFKARARQHSLGPTFVHGNYLVNLAASSPDNLRKSVENLYTALRLADQSGADGLIFHPGSAGTHSYDEAFARVIKAMEIVLTDYQGSCKLLMEVCAGQGQTIGDNFGEFADILKALNYDRRLGVCWDTCHLFAAGYGVSSAKGLKKTVDEFDSKIGFDWLFAIHANDSKAPLGSRRDRHENIGRGFIGADAFRRMLHHEKLRYHPWILEVPGYANKGPDIENINMLHELAL